MADKVQKYTPELVAAILKDYDGGNGLSIDGIADKYNLSKKSVLGKLVSLKAYVKPAVVVKTRKDDGPSKKEILANLEQFGFSQTALKGLENATKPALSEVVDKFKSVQAA